MKQNYIKPETLVMELAVASMLAQSSDFIPIDPTPGTPAANNRRGTWGNLWSEGD